MATTPTVGHIGWAVVGGRRAPLDSDFFERKSSSTNFVCPQSEQILDKQFELGLVRHTPPGRKSIRARIIVWPIFIRSVELASRSRSCSSSRFTGAHIKIINGTLLTVPSAWWVANAQAFPIRRTYTASIPYERVTLQCAINFLFEPWVGRSYFGKRYVCFSSIGFNTGSTWRTVSISLQIGMLLVFWVRNHRRRWMESTWFTGNPVNHNILLIWHHLWICHIRMYTMLVRLPKLLLISGSEIALQK